MPVLYSFLAAILPMFTYLLIIWRMDKYDREPLSFVLLHFGWGAFGAILLGVIGNFMLSDLTGIKDEGSGALIQTVVFAPVAEEIAKGVFLLFTINSKKFDNITDGLVYGGAVGLGFGMTENFTYFISYGTNAYNWFFLVIIRTAFSAVMHCISTATFGAFLGMAKFSLSKIRFLFPAAGLLIAIFYHFMWNISVSYENTYFYGFLFMIFLILLFFALFKYATVQEKKIIVSELVQESALDTLPKEHIPIISSHLRFRKSWVDEAIRKTYFRAAIKLAFARMQCRRTEGFYQQYYLSEVGRNRMIIKSLLNPETVDL